MREEVKKHVHNNIYEHSEEPLIQIKDGRFVHFERDKEEEENETKEKSVKETENQDQVGLLEEMEDSSSQENESQFELSDIKLEVKKGDLIAIIGRVGVGKVCD